MNEVVVRMQVGRLWKQGNEEVWRGCLYGIYDCVLGKTIASSSFRAHPQSDSTHRPRPVSLPTFASLSRLEAAWTRAAVDTSDEKADTGREAGPEEPKQTINKNGLDLRQCRAVCAASFQGDFEDFGWVRHLQCLLVFQALR